MIFSTFSSSLAFTLLILRWHGHTNLFESLYIIPSGFGSGTCIVATFVALNAGFDRSQTAVAGGGFYLSMNVGEVTIMSVCSAVLQASVRRLLKSRLQGHADGMEVRTPVFLPSLYFKSPHSLYCISDLNLSAGL